MLTKPRALGIGVSLVLLWILLSYTRLEHFHLELAGNDQQKDIPRYDINLSKEDFVSAAISSAVEDDFDYSYIRAMCDDQEWDSTVVFTCHGVIGGIGNIRQELLHCIRYAIDAGAGLLLPVINLRSKDNLSNLEDGTATMDYLFDQARFVSRLKTACPQMTIYKDLEELETLGPVTETDCIEPTELPHWPTFPAYSARARVKEVKALPGHISLIPFERVWHFFPMCHDPVGFVDTFGSLLPFRQDVYRLAATVLYELSSRYHLPIDPSAATPLPFSDTFIGIHLRTASDILPSWLKYAEQATYYLSRINASKYLTSLPIIYLASGNPTSIDDFSDEAQSLSQPKHVVTKNDLLSGADLEELAGLTWDQQALVDLLVLSRSAFFMGMADSSFAWTIAVGRRRETKTGSCGFRAGSWKGHLLGASLWDEFSDIMGKHGYGWESKMWP